jgi:hypothetical protein
MGCVKSVREAMSNLAGIHIIDLDLATGRFEFSLLQGIQLSAVLELIPEKYGVLTQKEYQVKKNARSNQGATVATAAVSKWRQLRPLFLIFAFLWGVNGLNAFVYQLSLQEFMLDFMAGFFLVFSFFKFLDLKGFVQAFSGYDPIAGRFEIYGWIYPFIELSLGLLLLTDTVLDYALYSTLFILGVTTIGVIDQLRQRNKIVCACLGSVLNLPMTEATLIENIVMLIMAGMLLLG